MPVEQRHAIRLHLESGAGLERVVHHDQVEILPLELGPALGQRIARLPDGTWETEDFMDYDPDAGEGLIPIRVKLTIEGESPVDVTQGEVVYLKGGAKHTFTNTGTAAATIVEVFGKPGPAR